jgi:hypothetical protein
MARSPLILRVKHASPPTMGLGSWELWWRQPFHAYDKESALLKWARESCMRVLQRGIHGAVCDLKTSNAAQTYACMNECRWILCECVVARLSQRVLRAVF